MMWQALGLGQITPGLEIGALLLGLAIAIILHEVAHGYVAYRLGDPTAYYAGRLTLNPLKHVDLWGTIIIPLLLIVSNTGFVFGWAKPVPVNYYNLRYGAWGPFLVAIAGPATNFVLVVISALLVRLLPPDTALPFLFYSIATVNAVLMLFNLIPLPPLDGSKILYVFLEGRPDIVQMLERYGLYLLLILFIFGQGLLSALVFRPALQLVQFLVGV